MEVAGSCCQPWSRQGSQWGWLDERVIPFLAWLTLMRHMKPDIIIHENSPGFDTEILSAILGDYKMQREVFNARDVGVPMSRTRQWNIMHKREVRASMKAVSIATLVNCTLQLQGHDLSRPVLRDTARLSQRYPPIARYGVFGVSTWPIGCDTPPPFLSVSPLGEHTKWRRDAPQEVRCPPLQRGIAAILARYPMKQGKWVRYPPLRYYLERVLRDMGGYLALGR